jgi:hypothetical protein
MRLPATASRNGCSVARQLGPSAGKRWLLTQADTPDSDALSP